MSASSAVPHGLAACIGVVQFFFVTTWTVYVIYLPALAEQAGIAKQWVPWILVADQALFAVMDVVTGYWVDRVRSGLARIGGWMLALTGLSCAAFVLLPFTSFAGPAPMLALIVLWAVTSSALRAPPWALLSRYAAKPELPWLSTLVLTGTAIASAAAPYLGIALKGIDPRVPFVLSTATLLAAVGALVLIERRVAGAQPAPAGESEAPFDREAAGAGRLMGLFFASLLVMALGFQVYLALNAGPQFLRFAAPQELPWLLPVFWIGFNLLMFPASRLVKRVGAIPLMAAAAAAGAVASLASVLAPGLQALLAAQFAAGGCWGAICVGAYTGAVSFGRRGREGALLGTLFAVFALATLARIGAVATGLAATPDFKALAPWIPLVCWALAAGVALLASATGARSIIRSPRGN
jgi:MFS family permease